MRLADVRRASLIHSGWLVRILAGSHEVHGCLDCGARMFVKARSGLCPMCFTRRRERESHIHDVANTAAGAALQDWPTLA